METIEQTSPVTRNAQQATAKERIQNTRVAEPIYLIRMFNKQADNFEKARFGWMAMLLTFQSCLGAVACMYISQAGASVVELAVCAAITMGSNALFIALAKPKVCLTGFYISVILNIIFILMTL